MAWISVRDRKPLPFQSILIYCDQGVLIGSSSGHVYFSNNAELSFKLVDDEEIYYTELIQPTNVTHWMPLPEPPKE